MASPQRENGHIDIANEIADRLCLYRISGQEWQIIWVVLRKTWGWLENPNDKKSPKKKMDEITLLQYQTATSIDRRKCHAILKKLIDKRILKKTVTQKGDKRVIMYGFQKDYERWRVSPKKAPVPQKGDKVSPKRAIVPLKETIKKKIYCPNSDEFRLSNLLYSLILERNPKQKEPNFQKWADYIRKTIYIDKRTPNEIEVAIKWCQQDNFWQNNILSTEKLRKQYDQIFLKMKKTNNPYELGFKSL